MSRSIREHVESDMECEGLLECFHGLTALDRQMYGVLADAETPLTVDELAAAVDRERSTAYRSVQRLVDAGFAEKEQVNYDDGGYYHVFAAADPDAVAAELETLLDEWHAQMGRLIGEFREKYADAPPGAGAEATAED